jgi:hypothetical protein
VHKGGRVHGSGLSDWAVWSVVEQAAAALGVENFRTPRSQANLRQTVPSSGGDLEQIKFLLGAFLDPDRRALPRQQPGAGARG